MHDVERDYIFCSHSNGSYSWIDLFFTNKQLLLATSETHIALITWSDPAQVSIKLFPQSQPVRHSLLGLNTSLLTNQWYE